MLRVAILTIDGQSNYGNRLQNFALQEALRSLDCYVETVRNSPEPLRGWSRDRLIDATGKALRTGPVGLARLVKSRLVSGGHPESAIHAMAQRANSFERFSARRILYSGEFSLDRSSSAVARSELAEAFDSFVVGSDQVWNPFQRHGAAHDFLQFAPPEKRAAYAASFGVDAIPSRYRRRYSRWLADMTNVSVREEKGAAIVKALTRRDVPVVLDPTLLLSAADWSKVATPAASKPTKPYLLTYFLGSVSPERRALTQRIARKHGLTVVSLNSLEDLSAYSAGPAEFVDYIASASFVLTDSFHGAVFSVLFRRRFLVFAREGDGPSMNSRLESLLGRFGLADQMYSRDEDFDRSPDYSMIDAVLDEGRDHAFTFLRDSVRSSAI